MSIPAVVHMGEFVVRAEDLELPPPDPFQEIQRRIIDAWSFEEAKKDAQMWGVSFVHHDVDGRWWIAHPDGTVAEHFHDAYEPSSHD